jgi:predicted acyltransferase
MTTSQISGGLLLHPASQRYLSLDVLRGLTVALMIVVNTPGSWSTNFEPLKHASWHGLTLTDLVFPSFLFVVGNAMSFSMTKLQNKGQLAFLKKVGKRTLLIFLIGLFLTVFPFFRLIDGEPVWYDFTRIRIMGVLQRIALCYAVAAVVIYYGKISGAFIFSLLALLGYWGIMYFFGQGGDPYSLTSNAATMVDRLLLGESHLYMGEGVPFDPEGLLSTLPAIVNVLAGYGVGRYIQQKGNRPSTVLTLLVVGALLILVGFLWDTVFPINKKIWTSSYVLVTVGISTCALAALMYVIEVLSLRKWTYFFEVFGRNPLILYVLSGVFVRIMSVVFIQGITSKQWLFDSFFLGIFPPNWDSLLFALGFMLFIWVIGYVMDRRKIYIKV